MSLNFEEIKKLSDKDKLKLIDDILDSIDEEAIDDYLSEKDEDNVLRERWEKYQSGKTTFNSWEETWGNL
jgi:putative addiction module component (TIGR02574 family)